jgi:hypothetical protein
MTLTSRPRSFVRFAQVAAVAVLASVVLTGCPDNKIGRKCDLDTDDAGTTGTTSAATINSQAVECPSRICLQPAKESGGATAGGLCTASCSSDDDCSDGQTSTSPDQCHTGFACLVATTVGDFCCQRLCVCRDFVDTSLPNWQKTPPVCEPGHSTCKNVH